MMSHYASDPSHGRRVAGLISSTVLLFPLQALAQTAGSTSPPTAGAVPQALSEVVVTANRRQERLQDVPISIVSTSAEQLTRAGVISTADLGQVTPGLTINQEGPYTRPVLRGVGTEAISVSIENPTAVYVDGVYIAGQAGSTEAFNNIERVEVDKGPQGTLFGRNATAGLIQIITRDPRSTFGWSGSVTGGDYGTYGGDLYLTGGLADGVAANLALYYRDQSEGFGRNEATGGAVNKTSDFAVRNKWLFTPTAKTRITLSADYEITTGQPAFVAAPGTKPIGGPPYTGPAEGADAYYQPHENSKREGASIRIQQDLGFASLSSLTAWRNNHTIFDYDTIVPSAFYATELDKVDDNQQLSQEFQLQSQPRSRIKWTVGSFLYADDAKSNPINIVSPASFFPFEGLQLISNEKTRSVAAYGQATTRVLTDTNLTVGFRFTAETRDATNREGLLLPSSPVVPLGSDKASRTYEQPTARISLDHAFTPDVLGYISYNRGFKSGGLNEASLPLTAYQPETIDAYEVGFKSQLFGRRVTLNTSGFYYDYTNIQTVKYTSISEFIYNGPKAFIYGVDVDFLARVTRDFILTAGVEALHSAYGDFPTAARSVPLPAGGTSYVSTNSDGTPFNAKGDHIALAPNALFNVGAEYDLHTSPGLFTYNINYYHNSGWFAEPDNRLHTPAYGVLNSTLAFSPKGSPWRGLLWGRNLGDSHYLVALGSQSLGDFAAYGAPRTYGFTLQKQF